MGRYTLRLYTVDELAALLVRAGFRVTGVWGGVDGAARAGGE